MSFYGRNSGVNQCPSCDYNGLRPHECHITQNGLKNTRGLTEFQRVFQPPLQMRPGRRLVAGVAAGLLSLVLFVGKRNFRHPGLTTRRLSDDASDACEYCERLTRDWEKRVCGILSGGADDGNFFSDYFSGIAASATRKPRYECVNGRFVGFCVESSFKRPTPSTRHCPHRSASEGSTSRA